MRATKLLLTILALLAVLFTGAGAIYLISHSRPEMAQQGATPQETAEKPSQQASAAATSLEPSKSAQPTAPQRPATRTPKYDVVRIEKGGEGVIAGKAEPGWRVIIEAGGEPVAEATADRDGEWAVVLSEPLPAGEHSLSLHAYSPDGNRGLVSDQTVVVSVAGKEADETVVALAEPGKATQVIQREQGQAASQTQAKPEAAKTPAPQPEAAQPAPAPEKPQAAAPAPEKPQAAAPAAPEPAPAPSAASEPAKAPQQTAAPQAVAPQQAAPVVTPPPGPAQELTSTPPAVATPPAAATAPAAAPAPAETTVVKSTPSTVPAKPSAEPKTAPAQQMASADDKPEAKAQDKIASESPASESTAAAPQPPATPAPSTQVARAVPADERPAPAEKTAREPTVPKAQVVFDAVDYEDSGDAGKVFLSGEAEPGAQIMIYLNNDLIAQATAGGDGKWNVAQDKRLDPGSYVVRADQVREGGKVVSRAEVTFERAAPEAVVASLAEAQETLKAKEAEEAAAAAPQRQAAAPSASEPEQAATTPKPRKKKRRIRYLVRRGDTLWDIAEQLYGAGWRYTAIFRRNRKQIRDPDLIYPNQRFRVR